MKHSRFPLLNKPRSTRKKRRLLYFTISAMLLVLAVVGSVNLIKTFNAFQNSDGWAQSLRLQGSGNEVIYLLYGVDYWGAAPYVERLVLVHHDTLSQKVNLIYIPGHTMVETEERGTEPLGQVYRRLGNPAFIELVEELTGLPVHHYLELNYQGIAVLGDYLGGIDAGVLPDSAAGALLPRDKGLLNGFELYRYFLTVDYGEPSWQQLNRQRHVLLGLWEKIEQRRFWHWPRLLNIATAYLETDLAWGELSELREQFGEYVFADMQTAVLPGEEEVHDGCLYWVVRPEAVAEMVRMVNEGYLVVPDQVAVEVLNGSGVTGLARKMAESLEEEGFNIVKIADADHYEYTESLVIARGETADKGRAVALLVPGSSMLHQFDPEARVDVTVIIGSSYLQYD